MSGYIGGGNFDPNYSGPSGSYMGGPLGGQNPQQLPNMPQFTEDFFVYTVAVSSMAGGTTQNPNITIQADSDFEWQQSTVEANLDGNAEPWTDGLIIPLTVLITDGGSGRVLMSQAVPVSGIFGTGKQPFIMPVRRRFKAKSTVTFQLVNYSASKYDNIYLNLIGRKIFQLG